MKRQSYPWVHTTLFCIDAYLNSHISLFCYQSNYFKIKFTNFGIKIISEILLSIIRVVIWAKIGASIIRAIHTESTNHDQHEFSQNKGFTVLSITTQYKGSQYLASQPNIKGSQDLASQPNNTTTTNIVDSGWSATSRAVSHACLSLLVQLLLIQYYYYY